MSHIGDTNKMVDTPRTDAGLEYDDTTVDGVKEFARRLEGELNAANQRITHLESALCRIANQDYRGNRSTESQIAEEALKEAKP